MIGRGLFRRGAVKPAAGGEKGQSLVMIVLLVTGLVAFAALAIDGGNYYSHRRIAQNAGDAGSLRGAWMMATRRSASPPLTEADLLSAIHQVVADNSIPDSNGVPNDGINTYVSAYFTDAEGETLYAIDPTDELPLSNVAKGGVHVEVRYPLGTYFAGFIGWKTLPVQASAVAVYKTGGVDNPLSWGAAVVVLAGGDICAAMSVKGGAQLWTVGGGMFDNSTADGTKNCCASEANGGASGQGFVKAEGGQIAVVGVACAVGGATYTPTPIEGVAEAQDFLSYLWDEDSPQHLEVPCGPDQGSYSGGTGTISPGSYSSIKVTKSGDVLTMKPGIYCINSSQVNDGFIIGGGVTVIVEGEPNPSSPGGVLIYIRHGSFTADGGATVRLNAMTEGHWAGLLIFSDPDNWDAPPGSNTRVIISGTSASTYTGTIYAPANICRVVGNGDSIGLNSRVMCYQVEVTGTGLVYIEYDKDENIEGYLPSVVSLYE